MVITIVAVLVGILLPVLGAVTHKKNTVVCLNNLRQLGTATLLFCNDNNGIFPSYSSSPADGVSHGNTPWNERIYSYIGVPSDTLATTLLKCPEDTRPFEATGVPNPFNGNASHVRSYSFNSDTDSSKTTGLIFTGGVYPFSRRLVQVTQPSKTLMITECFTTNTGTSQTNYQESCTNSVVAAGQWGTVAAVPKAVGGRGYYHNGQFINAVFVDGHAQSLTPQQIVGLNSDGTQGVSPFTAVQ